MNSEQLNYFILVADCGSFSAAEKKGYISKQAIIKQINQLENEVGVPLFERNVHGISLTESGKVFYEGARKLLTEGNELLQACRTHSGQPQVLRLSNVEHQKLLTPVTREFIRRYPDIEIEYIIHPNHSGEYRVIHGIMDIAETFHDPDENALEKIIASGASYTPLTNFPFVAVVSLEHAISTKEKLSLEELVPYETSYFPMITRPVLIQRLKEAFSSAPEHLHSISDIDKQISMTYTVLRKNGILVTCNPYVYYLKDIRILPLDVPETQEYGILMSDKPSRIAVLYRNLAVQMFRNAWGTHTRLPGTMPLI